MRIYRDRVCCLYTDKATAAAVGQHEETTIRRIHVPPERKFIRQLTTFYQIVDGPGIGCSRVGDKQKGFQARVSIGLDGSGSLVVIETVVGIDR